MKALFVLFTFGIIYAKGPDVMINLTPEQLRSISGQLTLEWLELKMKNDSLEVLIKKMKEDKNEKRKRWLFLPK